MPSDVCLIRTYQRPELLHHCLDRLWWAHKPESFSVQGKIDFHEGKTAHQGILDLFESPIINGFSITCTHLNIGDSCAFLRALKSTFRLNPDRIYNVEEDVLIAPDFFRWHQAAQAMGYDITVASNLHGDPRISSDSDPKACIEMNRASAIGCCFSRRFAELLVEHCVPEYYQSHQTMQQYLDRHFPGEPSGDVAWDGLMARLIRKHNLKVLWPARPRCYHAGWYGLNRGKSNPYSYMTLKDQIKAVGEVIHNEAKLFELGDYRQDCRVFSLEEKPWQKLKIIS